MTSLLVTQRQVSENIGYFIPLADIRTKMLSYSDSTGAFSTATWAVTGVYSSLVAGVGAGILKDLGRTIVSSTRVFRKVQLVVSSVSTFGVAGQVGTTWPQMDFLTAYIELGLDGGGAFTPVAHYGR
uniref:Uncharacterized protein n=1 Tax=viral metagenome TaxID=1070528 RepID=A0A6C0JV09_9ZZZZ